MLDSISDFRQYGYEPAMRKEKIQAQLSSDRSIVSNHPLFFMNEMRSLPVIKIPIELPIYRLANGRTKTLQMQYVAKEGKEADYFKRDIDSPEVQSIQHNILAQLIKSSKEKDSDLISYFSNPDNIQVEPIICTSDGVVVNGNRRLCCWRELYFNNRAKYKKNFQYILVAVLPPCNEAAIIDLELNLQLQKPIEEKYMWHAKALMLKELRDGKQRSTEEIARIFNLKKTEVEELITMYEFASSYLQKQGKENLWDEVSADEFAFKQLVKGTNKSGLAPGQARVFREITFIVIANKSEGKGRIYEKIPQIRDNIKLIGKELAKTLIEKDNDTVLPEGGNRSIPKDAALVKVLGALDDEEQKKVVQTIDTVIEEHEDMDKEKKNQVYIFSRITKANTEVQNAVNMLSSESNNFTKNGISEQLDTLDKNIAIIRDWIDSDDNNN